MTRLSTALAVLVTSILFVFAPSAQAVPVLRTLSVTGTDVATYPAFDPAITRYAATTSTQTGGTVTVTATTTDSAGRIWVNGAPASGPVTLSGLNPGDEISVIFDDALNRTAYSVMYLPAGFPTITTTTDSGSVQPGLIALTLNAFHGTAQPAFDTIVDRNGVPIYAEESAQQDLDLKQQPSGEITVSRPTTTPGKTGVALVMLDAQLAESSRIEVADPLTNTDGHDSVRLPNGSTILIGYEPNSGTGKTDATIQKLDSTGNVIFSWSSAGLEADTVYTTTGDYAHINSVYSLANGDILASFRHLSAVLLIATTAHDGYLPGETIWTLGGRASSLTFVNDPYGGPCAQHSATELANGHILIFDNGTNGLCVDPADPTGPTINRGQTRISEYAVDPVNHTATLVWDYTPAGRYAFFAGSAHRLANGDTLIGWAADTTSLASEVDAAGTTLWEVTATPPAGWFPYVTYRAQLIPSVPDAIDPAIRVRVPRDGASFVQNGTATAQVSCTDRGGSNLQTCDAPALDLSTVGTHSYTVTATDGAGNTTTLTHSYTVREAPRHRMDAAVRARSARTWTGAGTIGTRAGQTIRQAISRRGASAIAQVRIRNTGNRTERARLQGTGGDRWFRVRYFAGTTDITRAVRAGTYWTKRLAPRRTAWVRIVVTRRVHTPDGEIRTVTLRAHPYNGTPRDAVATRVRAR